jgi:hypothetical protein
MVSVARSPGEEEMRALAAYFATCKPEGGGDRRSGRRKQSKLP